MKLSPDQEKTLRRDERYSFLSGLRSGKGVTTIAEDGIVFDDGGSTDAESEGEDEDGGSGTVVKTSKKVGGKSAVTKEIVPEVPDDFNIDDI